MKSAQRTLVWGRIAIIPLFRLAAVLLLGSACLPSARAADDELPFPEGTSVGFEQVAALRSWLPRPFYAQRQFFFEPGMQLVIGPAFRDYAPPEVYQAATRRYAGRASIGTDGTLVGYVAGQPFPIDGISCRTDPQAGAKLIWNFVHRWQGFGATAHFRYSYLDRGQTLDLHYAGTTSAWILKHRPEPQFEARGGDVFERETRYAVIGFEIERPPEAAGSRILTYRYEASFGPLASAPPEDTWLFVREVRRLRKISQRQRNTAVAGTDFTFDDLFSFSGLPPQYTWECLGEAHVLAPMNTQRLGYPYDPKAEFGSSGLSFANDRWELRRAIRLRMVPKNPDHPYSEKELWLDRQTFTPLYSFAYDRKKELWKVIYHNHRWSEDALEGGGGAPEEWYPGWEGVPRPHDVRVVADAIVNVQTGTGNRLEFWDSRGNPPSLGRLRRYVTLDRLRKGR